MRGMITVAARELVVPQRSRTQCRILTPQAYLTKGSATAVPFSRVETAIPSGLWKKGQSALNPKIETMKLGTLSNESGKEN